MVVSCLSRKCLGVKVLFVSIYIFFFAGVGFASEGGITVIPDASLFVQIINFLLIIWILNVILYKPIRNMLIQRKEKIDNLENNIEGLNKDAKEKDDTFLSGIKEARERGLGEKNSLIQAATDEEKEIIEKINQKAQIDLAEVRDKIARETEQVRESLQKEIDSYANAIGEKILGRVVQ